jgi:RNA polymerase sigma-70 factor (ECF subfamily)
MNWEPDDTGGLMGDAAQIGIHDGLGQLPDHELVELVIEGQKQAYKTLVERYQGRIFRVAYGLMRNREDAREVTQEAFIKAYRNLPNFRRDSSFYTWIYRITVNLGIDQKRKAYRSRETQLDEGRLSVDDAHHTGPRPLPGPRQSLHRKELAGRIGEAIASLPDDQKQVIVLREVQGLSYKEIAETAGIAEGTVMSRLFYARKRLQVLLEDLR